MRNSVRDYGIRIQPMRIGDCVDAAFDLYRANLKLFLTISVFLFVPLRMGTNFLLLSPAFKNLGNSVKPQNPDDLVSSFILLCLLGMISLLVLPIQMGAVTVAAADRLFNNVITVKQSLRLSLKRFGSLIGTLIFIGLVATFVGVVIMFIGVIVVSVTIAGFASTAGANSSPLAITLGMLVGISFFVFALAVSAYMGLFVVQIVVLEGQSFTAAIQRNIKLVRKQFLQSAWILIICFVIVQVLESALLFPVQTLLEPLLTLIHIPQTLQAAVIAALDAAISLIIQPFSMVLLTVFYFERRCRVEGFDIYKELQNQPEPTTQLSILSV